MLVSELENKVIKAIGHVKDLYKECERDFTTEEDIVCILFSELRKQLRNTHLTVHSQVRPFYHENGHDKVIIEKPKKVFSWKSQEKANHGCTIDVAVIDVRDEYWELVLEKARRDQGVRDDKLKRWRILSYPVESICVAIEVKARVQRNFSKIAKDINELCRLREKNPKCLCFLVVLDRCSKKEEEERIKDYAEKRDIKCILYRI